MSASAALASVYSLTPKHTLSWVALYWGGPKCLDVAWSSPYDGGEVVQSWCSGQPNQRWELELASIHDDYRLRPRHVQNMCLDIADVGSPAQVIQRKCSGQLSQIWRKVLMTSANGISYYRFENLESGRCLTVKGASYAWAAPVVQASCRDAENQLWDLHDFALEDVK